MVCLQFYESLRLFDKRKIGKKKKKLQFFIFHLFLILFIKYENSKLIKIYDPKLEFFFFSPKFLATTAILVD